MKTIKFFVVLITLSLFVSCGDSKGNDGDVTLTASLYGTVVDSRTGETIPAAVVTIRSMVSYSDFDYAWGHTYSAVTGTDGHYEIPNIDKSDISKYGYYAIEKYFIEITADGYYTHQSYKNNCTRGSSHRNNDGAQSCANELDSHGWNCYTIVIDAGRSVQYDAALKKK
jgi:hypothetical protein